MKERPILFSGEMVRAILDGRKTQTRRIIKPQPPLGCSYVINGAGSHALCYASEHGCNSKNTIWVPPMPKSKDYRLPSPYGQPGCRLWVKETFSPHPEITGQFIYRADRGGDYQGAAQGDFKWKPSIYMPRSASRIALEILSVRTERLGDISDSDAISEGIEIAEVTDEYSMQCMKTGKKKLHYKFYGKELERLKQQTSHPVWSYETLWESLNGKGSWKKNPWVWRIAFRKL